MKRAGMAAYIAKSQAVLEELYPGTVTVEGTEFTGAASPLRRASDYEPGGEVEELSVVLRMSKETLAEPWEVGQVLTYQDRDSGVPVEMRVMEQSADEGAWIFRCGAAVKS